MHTLFWRCFSATAKIFAVIFSAYSSVKIAVEFSSSKGDSNVDEGPRTTTWLRLSVPFESVVVIGSSSVGAIVSGDLRH